MSNGGIVTTQEHEVGPLRFWNRGRMLTVGILMAGGGLAVAVPMMLAARNAAPAPAVAAAQENAGVRTAPAGDGTEVMGLITSNDMQETAAVPSKHKATGAPAAKASPAPAAQRRSAAAPAAPAGTVT